MMLNKKILFFLFLSVFIFSCKFYQFDKIAGNELKEFPKELRGNYFFIQKHKGIKDTVKISIDANTITSQSNNLLKSITLSDSVKLSKINKKYFVNLLSKDSSGNSVWQVFPFEYSKSKIYLNFLTKNRKNKDIIKYFKLKNNQLLLEMDSLKMNLYCDKKLKKRKAIKFKKYE